MKKDLDKQKMVQTSSNRFKLVQEMLEFSEPQTGPVVQFRALSGPWTGPMVWFSQVQVWTMVQNRTMASLAQRCRKTRTELRVQGRKAGNMASERVCPLLSLFRVFITLIDCLQVTWTKWQCKRRETRTSQGNDQAELPQPKTTRLTATLEGKHAGMAQGAGNVCFLFLFWY